MCAGFSDSRVGPYGFLFSGSAWKESSTMPAIDFTELRAQVRLGQVLELLRFEVVSRWGAQVRGPCPVHGSTRPRSRVFSADLERHCWHCFGRSAGQWAARRVDRRRVGRSRRSVRGDDGAGAAGVSRRRAAAGPGASRTGTWLGPRSAPERRRQPRRSSSAHAPGRAGTHGELAGAARPRRVEPGRPPTGVHAGRTRQHSSCFDEHRWPRGENVGGVPPAGTAAHDRLPCLRRCHFPCVEGPPRCPGSRPRSCNRHCEMKRPAATSQALPNHRRGPTAGQKAQRKSGRKPGAENGAATVTPVSTGEAAGRDESKTGHQTGE
jgi:hypothetical protein